MKKIFHFLISCWTAVYLLVWLGYIYIRCKITGTKYSESDPKFGQGFPTGYYKLKHGLRYYESGEIALEDFRGRCRLLISPEKLKELLEKECNIKLRRATETDVYE